MTIEGRIARDNGSSTYYKFCCICGAGLWTDTLYLVVTGKRMITGFSPGVDVGNILTGLGDSGVVHWKCIKNRLAITESGKAVTNYPCIFCGKDVLGTPTLLFQIFSVKTDEPILETAKVTHSSCFRRVLERSTLESLVLLCS